MSEPRPTLSAIAAGRLVCLLAAVLALGGQVAVGSRAADRLAFVLADLAGTGSDPSLPLCGGRHRAGRLGQIPPVGPVSLPTPCTIPASGDASQLLTPTPPMLASPINMAALTLAAGLATADAPPVGRARPYPRAPPARG